MRSDAGVGDRPHSCDGGKAKEVLLPVCRAARGGLLPHEIHWLCALDCISAFPMHSNAPPTVPPLFVRARPAALTLRWPPSPSSAACSSAPAPRSRRQWCLFSCQSAPGPPAAMPWCRDPAAALRALELGNGVLRRQPLRPLALRRLTSPLGSTWSRCARTGARTQQLIVAASSPGLGAALGAALCGTLEQARH